MRLFTTVYILLLAYVIAALVFWGLSLQKQNERLFSQELTILNAKVDSVKENSIYRAKYHELEHKRIKRKKQYVGEGATFLFVILIGAFIVYSSFRRSMRLSRQQNNFMLSVTHELKSPVAAIKLNLQTLEKHRLDEDKRNLLLEKSINEANRLNDLCNNMLLASQLEGRQYVSAKEQFDLSEMVEDAVNDYAHRYPRHFDEDIEVGCKISGDRTMLQMAINNLLENAVKYTSPGTPIMLKLETKNSQAVLQVIDEGSGIPDDDKKKVFNKFYRMGSEENRQTKGTGLGLYLTDKIVRQHKGQIHVKDNKPQGAIFEVVLPIG